MNWRVNIMDDDWFKVTMKSYGESAFNGRDYHLSSKVSIECNHYSTFKKIVEAIEPILKEEDKRDER